MSEKYQILARRYRPQKFSDVVGQEAIVTTIKNAIRLNKTAHAYIFSGSRGIGKTTLARLFAKALNCHHLTEDFEPCEMCQSCQEIATSSSLDVIEIDGASNRGIDDIRHINETIGYAPSSDKYKIYIIDEVHMLTKEAFNALLKTLEEPPEKVKFFFATTEPHKILPTILSRCQRFDLLRIPHMHIIKKLQSILQEIDKQADEEALHLVANFSEGSLRDAESLLDQLLCFEEGKISIDVVNKTLGFTTQKHFFHLDDAIDKTSISFAFTFIEMLIHAGKDLTHFLEELAQHFKTHLFIKLQHKIDYLSEATQEMYKQNSSRYSQEQLLSILDLIVRTLSKGAVKRLQIEMLLLQIIQIKSRISLTSLVHRLVQLETKIANQKKEKQEVLSPDNSSKNKDTIATHTEDIQLQDVPFTLSAPETKKIEEQPPSLQSKSRYDNLMQFAAVELEGHLKKDHFSS